MEQVPITRIGIKRLHERLKYLRRVVRPQVLEELREARSFGVKIDNQQYLAARERQIAVQRQIEELVEKIARCEIFVGRKFTFKQAGFGTLITIRNADTGEILEYQLVGPYESDVARGRLAIDSPVGQCLMGRYEGDEVMVNAPAGIRMYRIVAIEW